MAIKTEPNRNALVMKLRDRTSTKRMTFKEIAELLGIKRQRAWKIYQREVKKNGKQVA